ncbi:MAG: hypothetical protein PHT78_00725 [Desulfitobacteriaceae bacterium]|nr:hypothetical protein [Desulfitobacteriaceae bacterium]MDD4751766.1 hypothetical protein [Desulfitobacteriaceae bacterium]
MNKFKAQKPHIRFRTREKLQSYLERSGKNELNFRAYPISGEPETFHCSGGNVFRETDGKSFDSIGNFTSYAFQCDEEGYTHTEYVDLEVLT